MEENKPEKKETIKIKKTTLWQIITAVLAVLLVVSIFTAGFGITGKTTASGAVKAIILNDERCEECDVTGLISQLQAMVPGLEIEEIDYNSKEGKKLYEELELEFLPALLFDEKIKEQTAYTQMQSFIEQKGEYYSLMIGARFDPTAEICDNGIDDTGNDLVDCEDPGCESQLICREEIPEKLDLFVMSQCPYGTKALDAMEPILEAFPDIDFNIWYIASEGPNGTFSSLHGQPEVDENIRELCAIEHYPKRHRYMDYIWCRDNDIQNETWEPCAEEADMDPEVIRECFEGDEGKELLAENIKFANELGISASPSWIANNNYKFSGIDSATVQTEYCSVNPDAEGCGEEIESEDVGVEGTC